MLRVPAVCNSQAWRILSIGPSVPKYLLHSVILGAKCRWLIPLLPFLPCSTRPCHAKGLCCLCISGVLPSHSGDFSFAFWLNCPEQCLWEHGSCCGHGFSFVVCFWGVCPLWLTMGCQLWGWNRAALNCLSTQGSWGFC